MTGENRCSWLSGFNYDILRTDADFTYQLDWESRKDGKRSLC